MAEKKVTTKKATVKKAVVKKAAPKTAAKAESTVAVTPVKKRSALSAEVIDLAGKVVDTMSLPEAMFGARVNKPLMAQAVRVYLANQRAGSASTKTRGEVIGSTKKIYRQKGTGRARHGAAKAPIFVHGGVAHGPKPTDYSLTMPQKMRQKALFSALSTKLKDNTLKIVTGVEKMEPKTKNFAAFLKAAQLDTKKSVLVVLPEKSVTVTRSIRNIDGLTYVMATQLNTYDVLTNQTVLVLKDAVGTMEKHFLKEK